MNKTQVLKQLSSFGTAQNRKVYARHGVTAPMYGVSYANLGKLKRQIKLDQKLAEQLWSTGNHDARVLATMIADGSAMKASTLDTWAKTAGDHVMAAAIPKVVVQHPSALARAKRWVAAKNEFVAATGWNLVSLLAQSDNEIGDGVFEQLLGRIEKTIHSAPNRTRYSMNTALIGIGVRNARLQKSALAAAKKIGVVEVDHGETGCKTPDAASYIAKTVAHRKKQAAKAKSRKAPAKKASAKRAATKKKSAKKKVGARR